MFERKEFILPALMLKVLSLVTLSAVGTITGVAIKLSQEKGRYLYSPSSVIAMTELYKLCVTLIVVWRLAWNRGGNSHSCIISGMLHILTNKVTLDVVRSQLVLGLMYAFVNIVTFPIFMHMTASLFFLLKAASPVVTAIIFCMVSGNVITRSRWISILMQVVALIITQVNLCDGALAASLLGYTLMTANIICSCVAGVYNERIIKTQELGVNTQNFILYSFGIVINTLLYFVLPPSFQGVKEKPGFLEGYNINVLLVIISNGSIGLVITFVYKYADVLIKTFGVSISTFLLFLLESLGFLPRGRSVSSLTVTLLGSATVFYAAYVYVADEQTVPKVYDKLKADEMVDDVEEGKKPLAAKTYEGGWCGSLQGRVCNRITGLIMVGCGAVIAAFHEYNKCLL